jgi:hypothetical protein
LGCPGISAPVFQCLRDLADVAAPLDDVDDQRDRFLAADLDLDAAGVEIGVGGLGSEEFVRVLKGRKPCEGVQERCGPVVYGWVEPGSS